MRRLGLFALAVATAVAPACGSSSNSNNPSAQPVVFTAQLRASNEVPAISNAESNGQGTVTITFAVPRDASGNVTGDGTWNVQAVLSGLTDGSSITLAHIHTGAAGVAGGIFVNTGQTAANAVPTPGGGATINYTSVPITQVQAQTVMNNPAGFYFNMHTPLNPAGVVRGQLVRQ